MFLQVYKCKLALQLKETLLHIELIYEILKVPLLIMIY